MPRHIGVIAVSPEGSAVSSRKLACARWRSAKKKSTRYVCPSSIQCKMCIRDSNRNDWEQVARLLQWSSETLAAAGAEFCILPDNLAHHAAPMARASSPIPWLSMIDLVAEAVVADERKTVGLIGAKALTSGSIYQTVLGLKGIKVVVPNADDIEAINDIIFDELIHGAVTDASRTRVRHILDALRSTGCEGVILGSTETPLIVSDDSGLALYNPVSLLVDGAMQVATRKRTI